MGLPRGASRHEFEHHLPDHCRRSADDQCRDQAEVPRLEAPRSGLVAHAKTADEWIVVDHMRGLERNTHVLTESLTVAEVMTSGVIHCAPSTPLCSVASLMADNHVHAIFVFDYGFEDDETVEVWGLVSDLDVVAALPVIDERTAGDTAITPLVTVSQDERLERAAQLMSDSGTAHLCVVDVRTRRPVGVLSTLDIARAISCPPS
jgi:CBS domain-containing protein